MPKTVLITGCSTGIGRETAIRLAAGDYTVYATARRRSAIADLEAHGCRVLELDVTSEASMEAAVAAVEGGVDVLVNNAGVNELGAVESVPVEKMRALFEANVFGPVRMAQLVLPGMRERGWGRVINVGSMNGHFTFPGHGAYCASKHAVEAFSDALRFEARPFGIEVVLIQPGFVKTPFGKTAARNLGDANGGPYAAYNAKVAEVASTYDDGPQGRLAATPEDVAEIIEKAILKPKARYRVAPSAHILMTTRTLLPDAAFDALLRSQMPSPTDG